jgi:para-nitrobenzyl esterase
VFNTLSRIDRPWQPIDRSLAGMMSSYWANFARNGDPNGAGLPRWAAYDPATHTTMELGEKTGTMSIAPREKLEFFLARLAR